jgi:hypothetical protein
VYATPFPEVLAPDWLPPVLPDRAGELAELARLLGDPYPSTAPPWVASVVGPAGTGTSATARLAARRLLEALRRERQGEAPALVRVRVAGASGTLGVAAGLLQGLDSGFEPRGFPVAEILAGFVRRLLRDRRPAVVVLDDIGPDAPDLAPVVRALLAPSRFLPEGVERPPKLWTVLAGRSEAAAAWAKLQRAGVPRDSQVTLAPAAPATVRAVVADRAARALGRTAPSDLVERVVAKTLREDRGLSRALDLLRRELIGSSVGAMSLSTGPARPPDVCVEPRVLAALERATRGTTATLAEIRAWEVRLAEEEGVRPLPPTTLGRRMGRLHAAGVIRREVRPGGPGGTRSTIELVGPVPFYSLTGSDRIRRAASVPVGVAKATPAPARPLAA